MKINHVVLWMGVNLLGVSSFTLAQPDARERDSLRGDDEITTEHCFVSLGAKGCSRSDWSVVTEVNGPPVDGLCYASRYQASEALVELRQSRICY